jgi:hypothetical protein
MVSSEVAEKLVWMLIPLLFASITVLFRTRFVWISVKAIYGIAAFVAIVSLIASPQCLCLSSRTIILGALYFSIPINLVLFTCVLGCLYFISKFKKT